MPTTGWTFIVFGAIRPTGFKPDTFISLSACQPIRIPGGDYATGGYAKGDYAKGGYLKGCPKGGWSKVGDAGF